MTGAKKKSRLLAGPKRGHLYISRQREKFKFRASDTFEFREKRENKKA